MAPAPVVAIFFPLRSVGLVDVRSGEQPLKNPVIGRYHNLQRRIGSGDTDKSTRPRAGKLNISTQHSLNARRRRDINNSEVDSLFFHVTPLLCHGINYHLKTLRWDRHIDRLQRLGVAGIYLHELCTRNHRGEQ